MEALDMKPMLVYTAISDNGNKTVRAGDKIYVGMDYSLHNIFTGFVVRDWTWNTEICEFEVERNMDYMVRTYSGEEIVYRKRGE